MRRKLCLLLLSLAAIYVVNFSIPRLMPGDPFDYEEAAMGQESSTQMSQEQKEYLRAYYGLDRPFLEQLLNSVKGCLRGDLGQSIHYKHPVSQVLMDRLPWSGLIMLSTLAISLVLGVALALVSIRRRRADKYIYGLMSVLGEAPPFLVGVLLLFLVAARVGWIPLSGAMTPFARYDSLWQQALDLFLHALMPVTALSLVTIPRFYFTARASFLSIAGQPYVLTGRAKGLKEARIRWRYILFNALPPIVARLFLSVGSTVGGTILVENVFAYPGLGTVMREAVEYRDYPMIQGVFLLSTLIVLLSLFAADLINAEADKRGGQRL